MIEGHLTTRSKGAPVSELLVFDDEPEPRTALWHACTRVPTGAPGDSVTAVLSDMATTRYDCASVVAGLDGGRLAGVTTIRTYVRHRGP
jgi:magnesium transporter